MNPEAQRIAIHKACGGTVFWSYALPTPHVHCDVPDYLNDLNAIVSAVVAWADTAGKKFDYHRSLVAVVSLAEGYFPAYDIWDAEHATAAQRSEAFLRTLGKWEDGK